MPHPPGCRVCSHPSRAAIEQALVNGKGLLPTARTFGIGSRMGTPEFRPDHKMVQRHRDKCMGESYALALEKRDVEHGVAIGERLAHLDEVLDEAIARLREGEIVTHNGEPVILPDGSYKRRFRDIALLQAVSEARHNLELRHKMAGSVATADDDALAKARAGLEDATVRLLLNQVEQALADANSSGEQ